MRRSARLKRRACELPFRSKKKRSKTENVEQHQQQKRVKKVKVEEKSQCVRKKTQQILSSNLTASARCVAKRNCLLDLNVEGLVRAKFLRRPSRRNRSPYGTHAVL